jgi:hypothetical protein
MTSGVVDGLHPSTSLLLMLHVKLVLCPVGAQTVGILHSPGAWFQHTLAEHYDVVRVVVMLGSLVCGGRWGGPVCDGGCHDAWTYNPLGFLALDAIGHRLRHSSLGRRCRSSAFPSSPSVNF